MEACRAAAVDRVVGGLSHPLAQGVEHGDVEGAAGAGALPLVEGGEDARVGVHAGRDVGDRDSDLGGFLGCAGDAEQACLALDEQVIGLLAAVGTVGAVAGDRAVDQVRPAGAQGVGVQAEPFDGARDEVLHEHVGCVDEPLEQRAVGGVLDVELDALLAAVEPDEVAGLPVHGAVVVTSEVTDGGALDLDDPGAEVGELPGGEGCGDRLLE
jgi:hypothetical protein